MSHRTPEQCLERAALWDRQAAATKDLETRQFMQGLADRWRALGKSTIALSFNPKTS